MLTHLFHHSISDIFLTFAFTHGITEFPPLFFVYCIAPDSRLTVRVSAVVVVADTELWAFCRSVAVSVGTLAGPLLAHATRPRPVLKPTIEKILFAAKRFDWLELHIKLRGATDSESHKK